MALPHVSIYFASSFIRGVDAFIGRNYLVADSAADEEEYLDAFLKMAIEPEDRAETGGGEEEYLSLFMAHSMEEADEFEQVVSPSSSDTGLEIKYSRFVSSYNQLDRGALHQRHQRLLRGRHAAVLFPARRGRGRGGRARDKVPEVRLRLAGLQPTRTLPRQPRPGLGVRLRPRSGPDELPPLCRDLPQAQ